MKKRTWKRTLCYLLIAALLAPSLPIDTTKSQAATESSESSSTISEGVYTTGVFAGKYGIDQLFDYIMDTSTLNNLPFDASWGDADDSNGHQLTKEMMKDKHFVLKYSGDEDYPIALCLYNDFDNALIQAYRPCCSNTLLIQTSFPFLPRSILMVLNSFYLITHN